MSAGSLCNGLHVLPTHGPSSKHGQVDRAGRKSGCGPNDAPQHQASLQGSDRPSAAPARAHAKLHHLHPSVRTRAKMLPCRYHIELKSNAAFAKASSPKADFRSAKSGLWSRSEVSTAAMLYMCRRLCQLTSVTSRRVCSAPDAMKV